MCWKSKPCHCFLGFVGVRTCKFWCSIYVGTVRALRNGQQRGPGVVARHITPAVLPSHATHPQRLTFHDPLLHFLLPKRSSCSSTMTPHSTRCTFQCNHAPWGGGCNSTHCIAHFSRQASSCLSFLQAALLRQYFFPKLASKNGCPDLRHALWVSSPLTRCLQTLLLSSPYLQAPTRHRMFSTRRPAAHV